MTITHTLACDCCGDDRSELRVYPNDDWVADDILCRACFFGRDPENSFSDFPIAQRAVSARQVLRTAEAFIEDMDTVMARAAVRPAHRTPLRVYAGLGAIVLIVALFVGFIATTALAKAAHDVAHAEEYLQ